MTPVHPETIIEVYYWDVRTTGCLNLKVDVNIVGKDLVQLFLESLQRNTKHYSVGGEDEVQ